MGQESCNAIAEHAYFVFLEQFSICYLCSSVLVYTRVVHCKTAISVGVFTHDTYIPLPNAWSIRPCNIIVLARIVMLFPMTLLRR